MYRNVSYTLSSPIEAQVQLAKTQSDFAKESLNRTIAENSLIYSRGTFKLLERRKRRFIFRGIYVNFLLISILISCLADFSETDNIIC